MRVLVVDDHPLFRDGITSLLNAAGYEVIGESGDGETAVTDALRLEPDLILMDIRLPGITGLEALHQIKAKSPNIEIVMLTASESESGMMEAIKAGASGYLQKNVNPDELLINLRGLELGELAISRQAATTVIQRLVGRNNQPIDPAEDLTPREIELLKLVAEGLSNRAIAQQLSVSDNTVKYHLKKISQKLGVQNRTEAATWALSAGLFKLPAPN